MAFQYLDQFPRMYDVFADEVMAPLDKNNDGVITLDEFQQGLLFTNLYRYFMDNFLLIGYLYYAVIHGHEP